MAVLYRKYRPQVFAEVLNQKYIIQTLKNQVASGKFAHAYLFTGSRGVGKTSAARILAKAVNCQNPKDGDACGICSVCKQIEVGNFMDLVEIDAASNTGVDNIRELIEHVKFAPNTAAYKVFIIDEVHMLSKGAFNALLKTLEEPPKHAIFILATTEINKVPATIVSRTQRFDFKALSSADILVLLKDVALKEGTKISSAVLELVAQNAEGSVRDALSLLGKVLTLGEGASLEDVRDLLGVTDLATCEKLLGLIAEGNVNDIPEFFRKLSEKGLDYAIFNRDFLEFLRKALIYKITGSDKSSGMDAAEKFSANDLIFIVRLFLKSYKDLVGSPLPEIPMLVASIEAGLRKTIGQQGSKPSNQLINKAEESTANILENNSQLKPPVIKVESVEVKETQEVAVVSLDEAREVWPKAIIKIREINGPLASMLKNTQLMSVEGGKIILGVKFKFDKQSLELPKNYELICKTLLEVSGKRISVSGEVLKLEVKETATPTEAMADALKLFGGEVIE